MRAPNFHKTRDLALGIREIRLAGLQDQRYYLAEPNDSDTRQVLVLMHGISRNAKLLIESFSPLVQGKGITLVAPLFEEQRCRDYQRLGRSGKGPRADLAITSILSEVTSLTGWNGHKAMFFGHSAGAQLVQRFMFAHPQLVDRAALSGAGWYTFPRDEEYPLGIRPTPLLPGVCFEPLRFLRVPAAVFIGLEDTVRDESLNCSRKIDHQQGRTRLDRARKWVRKMNMASRKLGLSSEVDLFEIEAIGHDYNQAVEMALLNERVIDWLLGPQQA